MTWTSSCLFNNDTAESVEREASACRARRSSSDLVLFSRCPVRSRPPASTAPTLSTRAARRSAAMCGSVLPGSSSRAWPGGTAPPRPGTIRCVRLARRNGWRSEDGEDSEEGKRKTRSARIGNLTCGIRATEEKGKMSRVVVVTGAGGTGCGRAIAVRFATGGASVVVSDINEAGGHETVRLIEGAGGRAAFFRTDVRSESQAQALISFAETTFGGLHVLVNNASAPRGGERLEEWTDPLETDLLGAVYATRWAIESMRRGSGGAV